MSKIYIFTPTAYYGGIDVTFNSLLRQGAWEFTWIVSDDLFDERADVWERLWEEAPFEIIYGKSAERKPGYYRNLCSAYNAAVDIAVEDPEAEMFVTLQDYIWIPDDGIEKFWKVYEDNPDALVSGLTSISLDPTPDKVVNPRGGYTIFAKPFRDEPKVISWSDCRRISTGVRMGNYQEWEANWGYIPVSLLRDGLRWTEEYDIGVAYENQDLALKAVQSGHSILVDQENHAVSLPHKAYFREREAADVPHINKEFHEGRWKNQGVIL